MCFLLQVIPRTSLPGPVSALSASPSGRHLAASVGRDIFLWQCSSGALLRHLRGAHLQDVTCLAWTQDGAHLVSGSEDGGVYAWRFLQLADVDQVNYVSERDVPV